MSDFWCNWKKPWNREQCERRYVEGEKIGLRGLSALSGVSDRQISRWSRQGNWTEARLQFVAKLTAKTREKAIEKISNDRSEELRKLSEEHLKGYQTMRRVANVFFAKVASKVSSNSDEVFKIPSGECQKWAIVFDKAVQGERQATGMDYEDLNLAIAALERHGYQVFDPSIREDDKHES